MKRFAVVLGTIVATLFVTAVPSQAYEAGRRYGGFSYPNFSGYSLALSAWFNVDSPNDKVRGYGYTDPPNVSGFRSSALSEMRYELDGGGYATISGNRIYGFTEQLVSSTYLMGCNNYTTNYYSLEHWRTTDAYDYNYQGSFQSYIVGVIAGC